LYSCGVLRHLKGAVNLKLLLKQQFDFDIHSNVVRWLAAYLHDRRAATLYHSCQSPYVKVHCGVPQGSVLSPTLFNFFISDFLSQSFILTNFADDFYVGEKLFDLDALTKSLNEVLKRVASARNLKIAPEKSSVILFSPDPHQTSFHPQVFLHGSLVLLAKVTRWLGVEVDSKINSSHHVSGLVPRLSCRVRVMQALAGSTFGQCKEMLIRTYKAICQPLMEFNCQIWAPYASATSSKHLQTVQNKALHIATGCHMAMPIAHLHTETKVLPVAH
jgi:hypothetical protein